MRLPGLSLVAAMALCSEAAVGQDYTSLAETLSGRFDSVRSKSKSYLNTPFVADPGIKKSVASQTVSNQTDMRVKGMPIQRDNLLLQLKPEATGPQIDALLKKHQLQVVGGVKEIGLLIVQLDKAAFAKSLFINDTSGSKTLKSTAKKLRNDPIVQTAATNVLVGPSVLPKESKGEGPDSHGAIHVWDWKEGPGTPAEKKLDGNYGQKMTRFPNCWNFNEFIRKQNAPVKIGILDVGFAPHEDLTFQRAKVSSSNIDDHGNHVLGIVGANFDNETGVNGVSPFGTIVACSSANLSQAHGNVPGIYLILSDVIATLVDFMLEHPDLKVVNLSLGYNWVPNYGIDPNTDLTIQDLVASHGVIVRALANFAASRGVILVSAAGNDSGPGFPNIEAQWASPFNYAALNKGANATPGMNIIVVESVGRSGQRSPFSNVKGCISAPGENILSSVAFDGSGNPSKASYAAYSGTSMASPHVCGLISLMYALNPKLSVDDVVKTLNVQARPATAPATIDAFDILLRSHPASLKILADLNGDGKVDMADFNIFKAELASAEAAPAKNLWPRSDLNGSGKLSRNATDLRPVLGVMRSDLEVMMSVWEDPTVPAKNLPGMIP